MTMAEYVREYRDGLRTPAAVLPLSGSLVALEPARAGDVFEMELHGVGGCTARFV